jgi:hypothetical protein
MSFETLPDYPLSNSEASLVKADSQASNSLVISSSLDKVFQVGEQLTHIIDQIPQYWQAFWQAYQRPIVVFGWALLATVIVKIALAVLVAIQSIPLLAPLMQLLGLSYTLWFVIRHFLGFSQRQEIFARLDNFKSYIWGTTES